MRNYGNWLTLALKRSSVGLENTPMDNGPMRKEAVRTYLPRISEIGYHLELMESLGSVYRVW